MKISDQEAKERRTRRQAMQAAEMRKPRSQDDDGPINYADEPKVPKKVDKPTQAQRLAESRRLANNRNNSSYTGRSN